jgi:cytochrome b561
MPHQFPLTIRLLHWTMAALIIAMLFIGVAMVSTAGPAYTALLALHRPLGIAILLLAGIRLALRIGTRAPALPADLPRIQQRAARASHVLLYLAMIGLPIIGWAMLSAGSYPVRLGAGLVLPPILPPDALVFGGLRQLHALVAFAFFALILGHLTVALIHGFVRRDGVLATMGFARSASTEPAAPGDGDGPGDPADGTDAPAPGDAEGAPPP